VDLVTIGVDGRHKLALFVFLGQLPERHSVGFQALRAVELNWLSSSAINARACVLLSARRFFGFAFHPSQHK
jgi:hypothetical protein